MIKDMNDNMPKPVKKIVFSAGLALCTSFLVLYAYLSVYDSFLQTQDYQLQGFFDGIDFQKKKIFLLGTSSVDVLNVTRIDEHLTKNGQREYEMFNLAHDGDRPTKRINQMDQIITAEPDIVFYGLGMREFGFNLVAPGVSACPPIRTGILPVADDAIQDEIVQNAMTPDSLEPLQLLKSIVAENIDGRNYFVEPKYATVSILRLISDSDKNENKTDHKVSLLNNTYSNLKKQGGVFSITPNDRLEASIEGDILSYCQHTQKEEIDALKHILDAFQDNGIPVVVFVAPYSGPFVDGVSDVGLRYYFLGLDSVVRHGTGMPLYTFLNEYEGMEIFHDVTHVAANPDSAVFSDDFAQLALEIIDNMESDPARVAHYGNDADKTNAMDRFMYRSPIKQAKINQIDLSSYNLAHTNLVGANLKNSALSSRNFSHSDFTFADMSGADLSGSDLSYAKIEETHLDYANLSDTDLRSASFLATSMDFANLNGAILSDTDFKYSSISLLNMSGQYIANTTFAGAMMFGSDFSGATLDDVDFSKAQLANTSFRNAIFRSGTDIQNNESGVKFAAANLINADLSGTDLSYASIWNSDMGGANLTGSILRHALLNFAHMPSADLSFLDLSNSFLISSVLSHASLQNANLSGADAIHADLFAANLTAADLSGTDLTAANLANADLTGANLTGASLKHANLTGAILTGTVLNCYDHPLC